MSYTQAMLRPSPSWRVFFVLLLLLCPATFAKKKPPPQPININAATSEELQEVPGIGPATADKILQMRKSYGAFKSVNDLLSIRGIGPKRLEKMRKYLVAGKAAPAVKAQAAGCSGCDKPKTPPGKAPPSNAAPVKKNVTPPADAPASTSSEPEEPS
jgi:competence ComEA-like helix-hairpin-helix protein